MSKERDDLRSAAWAFGDRFHEYRVKGGLDLAAVAEYTTMRRESGTFDTVADLCVWCRCEAARWREVAEAARWAAKRAEEAAKAARRDLAAHRARVRALQVSARDPERKRLDNAE